MVCYAAVYLEVDLLPGEGGSSSCCAVSGGWEGRLDRYFVVMVVIG